MKIEALESILIFTWHICYLATKMSGFFANNENNTEMERKSEINAMKGTKGQRDPPPCSGGWAGTGGVSLKLPACGSPPGGTDRTGGASPPTESEDGTKELLLSEGVFGRRHGDDERVVPDVGLTVGQEVGCCLGHLHPVHAGFHLQLLHSLPGLGDAGGAATGHAFLHPAAPAERRHGDRPGQGTG